MPTEVKAIDVIRADVKSVDSKINLLAEKLKRLETQNLTIANSLFKITERMKKIEEGSGGLASMQTDEQQSTDIGTLREELEKALKENETIKSEIYNMKYTVGLINPLEFVTISQLDDLVEEAIAKRLDKLKKK
ncbi:MAG: hypothetical protein V1722_03975 [Candidatus Micrarchaeota archaeon]